MRYLPIHVDTQNTTIRVFGGEEAAEAKLRTLLKTEAKIEVYADVVRIKNRHVILLRPLW